MLAILLYDGYNGCRDDSMCFTKVGVDFFVRLASSVKVVPMAAVLALEGKRNGLFETFQLFG